MKSLVFVGIFSVLIASIYASDSAIPAFFWSGKNYFSGKNVEVLDNINALDVESSFDQITKSPSTNNLVEASALQNFINTGANTKPEVVVLFVASKLRVDQITRFSGANDADNTGGAFANLKDAISASSSSLVVPYTSAQEAFAEPLAEHLAARAGRIIVAQKGNYFLSNLRNKKNVKFISLEQLSGLTAEGIFNNGVTDVVVVALDTDNSLRSFQAADEIVGQVEDLVAKATAGNYVAVFTGRTAEAPKVAQPVIPRRRVAGSNTTTPNPWIDDSDFWRYFPYQIWEVIVVSIPLLLILATGLTCLCMVQTPDRFEGGIRGRQ